MAKKRSAARADAQQAKTVTLVIEPSDETHTHYSNHAEVGHSQHDFFLLFSRLPTKPTAAERELALSTGKLPLRADVQVILPASMVGGLIDALVQQRAKYEKQHGPIADKWKAGKKSTEASNVH